MAKHKPSLEELQAILWDMPRGYSDEELELFLNCDTARIIDTAAEASEDSEATAPEGNAELEKQYADLQDQLDAKSKENEDLIQKLTATKQAMENRNKETKAASDELQKKCADALEQLTASEARDEFINPVLGQVAKLAAVLTDEEKEKLTDDVKVAVEQLLELNQKVEDLNTDPA